MKMQNEVSPPNEAENHQLRQDAQTGIPGARAALGGDYQALADWREQREDSRER